MNTQVLIIGAGPTGLVLALWLTKQGVRVRIVDKTTGPGENSRAMAVHARTLELYRQMNLTEDVIAAGQKNPAVNLWVGGTRKATVALTDAGKDLTPYPFLLVYPQDLHERLLVDRLAELGVTVERETELIDFEEKAESVVARLRLPDGREDICEAIFLAGCDGARSTVRQSIGADFDGITNKQVFYVADVEITGLEPADQAHLALDSSDFVAVLSYGKGKTRLIGMVKDERAERAETLTFDDVSHQAIESLNANVKKVNWFSTYRIHHRVTDNFRKGRIFLLGDAAHIHSPAGGQGMNTGIGDAINLAWKLTAVLNGKAQDSLLDSYDEERRAFAEKLVDTTDRVFSFVTTDNDFATFVRTRIAPSFASLAYKFEAPREFLFRLVSQTALSYHESVLSKGVAGKVRGGDRLPWVPIPGNDNFDSLVNINWQVHVYGTASQELQEWCQKQNITLQQLTWNDRHSDAGFMRDAAYLLRPDTYVAFADPDASPENLAKYFDEI